MLAVRKSRASAIMSEAVLRRARRIVWMAVAALCASVAVANAQNVGTVSGVVKDPQGLPAPGVTVSLLNRVSQIDVSDLHDAVVILQHDTALLRLGDAQWQHRLIAG